MKIYLIFVALWLSVAVAGGSGSKALRGAKWRLGSCPRSHPVAIRETECAKVCHPVPKTCKEIERPRPIYDSKSGLKLRNCPRCIDGKSQFVAAHESTHAPTTPPPEDQDSSENPPTSDDETNSTINNGNASGSGEPRQDPPGLESGQSGFSCPSEFPVVIGDRRCSRECPSTDNCDYVADGFVLYDSVNNITLEGCATCYVNDVAPIPTDSPKPDIPGLESGQVNVPCPDNFPVLVGERRCSKECPPTDNCDYVADGFVIYDADDNITLLGCPVCYVNDVVPTPPLEP